MKLLSASVVRIIASAMMLLQLQTLPTTTCCCHRLQGKGQPLPVPATAKCCNHSGAVRGDHEIHSRSSCCHTQRSDRPSSPGNCPKGCCAKASSAGQFIASKALSVDDYSFSPTLVYQTGCPDCPGSRCSTLRNPIKIQGGARTCVLLCRFTL